MRSARSRSRVTLLASEAMGAEGTEYYDDAYARTFPGRTVIVLPSRLSTVKKADRVIVLHRGRVEAADRDELH